MFRLINTIEPHESHSRIEETGHSVLLITPGKFKLRMAFELLTVIAMLYLGPWISKTTHDGRALRVFLFLVAAVTLKEWLWAFLGEEILEFNADALISKKRLLGFSRKRKFPLAQVRGLYYVPEDQTSETSTPSGLGFDFKDQTFRYADDLEEADLEKLITLLRYRFPIFNKTDYRPESNHILKLNL